MKSLWKVAFILLAMFLPLGVFGANYLTFVSSDPVAASDLALEVEGESVQIVDFFQVDTQSADTPFLYHPAGRRQLIFLYDLIFSKASDVVAARATTLDFLKKAGASDLIVIAGITTEGLKIYCAPTADRNQVIAGLNLIGRNRAEGFEVGPEGNYYMAQFHPDVVQAPVDDDAFLKNLKPLGLGEERKEDHAFLMVQGMVDFAYALSAVQGRKTVVFFSPGFETRGISLNLDLETKRSESRTSSASQAEPASLDSITNSTRDLEAEAQQGPPRRPRQHGVDVIPGLFSGTDSHVYVVSPAEHQNGFLQELSQKTGGRYFQNQCEPEEVLSSERTFYVVQWQDPRRTEWKPLNSVKISAGDHRISTAGKWMPVRPPLEQSPEEKRMHVAETVYKDFTRPPDNYQFWADHVFEQGYSKIPVFAQINASELLKRGESTVKLEFYSYSMTRNGAVLDAVAAPVELDLSNDKLRERIAGAGLKVWNVLLADERPLMIRNVIIYSNTGETYTSSVYLDVKETELTMSNPFIPSTNFAWIVWPRPQDEQTRRGIQLGYPYHEGDDGFFFPDLTPEIKPGGSDGVVYFRLYNMLPESKGLPVRFHLTDAGGQSVELQDFHLLKKPVNLEHAGMELFWDLAALPEVQPGSYRIKIGILDPVRKQVIVREIQNLKIRS